MKQFLWGPAAAVLAVSLAAAARADEPKGFTFDLSVDLIGADIGDLGGGEPLRFDLGGLPVSLGTVAGGDTGNPGLRAALGGDHTLAFGGGFSLVTSGSLQKTRYLVDSFYGSDRLAGGTSLRYQNGSFKTALEPGVDLDFFAGAIETRHLVLDGRMSRTIAENIAMSLSTGIARREHPGDRMAGADLGYGKLGVDFTFGAHAKLDLAYDIRHSWAEISRDSTARSGPSIGLDLATLAGLDLGLTYQYCESTRYDDLRERVDTAHAFGLTATWQDADTDYLTFSGGYRLDRTDRSGDDVATSHDAMINMALKF